LPARTKHKVTITARLSGAGVSLEKGIPLSRDEQQREGEEKKALLPVSLYTIWKAGAFRFVLTNASVHFGPHASTAQYTRR